MKQYVAKTGGRYTYTDDLLNLQELALSMTAIFDGCSNFIISGCNITGAQISPGYVWINGHIRHFEGCVDALFPYYIYERNNYDTVTYANDVNKHGRCNYLCMGGASVPQQSDDVTGALPGFIEVKEDYTPRFIDKFFGKYAVLLETPFSKQTIRKDLALTGQLTGEKEIESKTALSASNPQNGYTLKSLVKPTGDASIGIYNNGLLIGEVVLNSDGSFVLTKQGVQIAKFSDNGHIFEKLYSSQFGDFGGVRIQAGSIYNYSDSTDEGSIRINRISYKDGNSLFRNFEVYDGKNSVPIFFVEGKNNKASVNGDFAVCNRGRGIDLHNTSHLKTDTYLVNAIHWWDMAGEKLGYVGFADENNFDFTVKNIIGNIQLEPLAWLNVKGELRVNGVSIADTYVTQNDNALALGKKVDKIQGKGLSSEDFTTEYKKKLDQISQSDLSNGGNGFVTASDVVKSLATKLSIASNLADVKDTAVARTNLEIFSKNESDGRFLRIKNYLSEITALSSTEIDGKTPEEIITLKEQRQQSVRDNIAAEKKGTGELKLAKASNLSDLSDKEKSRYNLGVYSIQQIDKMLEGKLGSDEGYSGIPFTSELKAKLDGIKTGSFAGMENGVSQTQVEGYVMTSAVKKELDKKANRLLDGYSGSDKDTVATNIGVYTKTEGDARYGRVSQSFQDYINYHTNQGKTTSQAKAELRNKIDALGKDDLNNYLKKEERLNDLPITTDAHKKDVCKKLGAAYAPEYQTKLNDTGWINCGGSNGGTLYARQIGNIVCIQGTLNTGKREGNNKGGVVATIPNQISPPKYGCRTTLCDWNDDNKYNRGSSFIIRAGSRSIEQFESGWNNKITEIHFSYMT